MLSPPFPYHNARSLKFVWLELTLNLSPFEARGRGLVHELILEQSGVWELVINYYMHSTGWRLCTSRYDIQTANPRRPPGDARRAKCCSMVRSSTKANMLREQAAVGRASHVPKASSDFLGDLCCAQRSTTGQVSWAITQLRLGDYSTVGRGVRGQFALPKYHNSRRLAPPPGSRHLLETTRW